MKIIILGAGQVGGTLAEHLASENNDVVLVDTDRARLHELQNRLDIGTVYGSASYPDILKRAGGDQADMLIAVTNSDETNLVACRVAQKLFQTPQKIARIRSREYLAHSKLFEEDTFSVDVVISPEKLVTRYVERLIEHPGTLQVLDFADGKAQLVVVRAYYHGPLVGKSLKTLYESISSNTSARIIAIYRRGEVIPLEDNTVIEANDEVFFLASRKSIQTVLSALRREEQPYQRIMIAGAGNIGTRLARELEKRYHVKLIDHNKKRSQLVADSLHKATVLLGDACDIELLREENIEAIDVFCALTNDDEANIMSALQAKRLGVRQVMALINRSNYVDLIEGSHIDIAISPQQATISSILTFLRRGDVANVHALRHGAAEAIEVVVHGDRDTSKVIGRKLEDIGLPAETHIAAIVRDKKLLIADSELEIAAEDHVILFVSNKKRIRAVEKLFQVDVKFI